MREPVPGTGPIGGLQENAAFFTGKRADDPFVATIPATANTTAPEAGYPRPIPPADRWAIVA